MEAEVAGPALARFGSSDDLLKLLGFDLAAPGEELPEPLGEQIGHRKCGLSPVKVDHLLYRAPLNAELASLPGQVESGDQRGEVVLKLSPLVPSARRERRRCWRRWRRRRPGSLARGRTDPRGRQVVPAYLRDQIICSVDLS